MKNRRMFKIAWYAAAAALVAVAYAALRPKPIKVDFARVKRGELLVTIDEDGRTRIRDSFVVAAPISGQLKRIAFKEGETVSRGATLALIEPPRLEVRLSEELKARVEAAEDARRASVAAVEQVRAELEQARRERERAEKLYPNDISRQTLEQAVTRERVLNRELETAELRAESAAHEVEAARAGLLAAGRKTEPSAVSPVVAPASGRVIRVMEKSERMVAAGTPLVEIGDSTDLEAVIDVLSTDAVNIRPGMSVIVEKWGGDRPLAAVVRKVEPSAFTKVSALGIEEQRVNVTAQFPQIPPGLGGEYRIEARIVVWKGENVVKVPLSALFRNGDAWEVFVVSDGRAFRRPVVVGRRGTVEAEIRSGLGEGEEIVLFPGNRVTDGCLVTRE